MNLHAHTTSAVPRMDSPVDATVPTSPPTDFAQLETPRTFVVVFRRDPHGPMWKIDAMADSAIDAGIAVAYREQLPVEAVVAVIDAGTLR